MGQTGQTGKKGQTDQPFRLFFPGNLCRAAFTILAMYLAWFLDALASLDFKLSVSQSVIDIFGCNGVIPVIPIIPGIPVIPVNPVIPVIPVIPIIPLNQWFQ